MKKELAAFEAHSQAIVGEYLDGQTYARQRLVNETRFFLATSAETMLEAGRRLIVMKEHETHGEFQEILQQEFDLSPRTAQVMMQAAAKFMSPKLVAKSKGLTQLGKTKLYELMLEDDDELAALGDGGTVAGLTLDDIDRMSSRELRKALRDAREDGKAKDEVIADKNKKLDELATSKKRIKTLAPDAESEQIRREATDQCFQAEVAIRNQMRHALLAVQAHAREHNIDVQSFIGGQLNQIEDALLEAREELCVYREAPEWAGDFEEVEEA